MKINHIIVSTEKVIENKRPMSRAAKGNEKYGKNGMKALAKAGREGASEKKLDAVRNKYDNYNEGWSQKYKSSINCSHPKGFSQKAHCAGKKKHNESIEMEMVCEDCGMCKTHGDHSQKSLDEACWKRYHKEGMKTMFGKKYPNCIKNKNESLETYVNEGKCPGCGGAMVGEGQLNEKQDACYHKVKSRYKVWPSAYASGALVQCRKKGAANWGNSNESITQEEYNQLDENLKKWFSDKWVRFGPDGKIKGDCARGDDSEGKPKCLPQSKAQSLGKKGRASAASRKRREDPNPERSGPAINVNTKKEKKVTEMDKSQLAAGTDQQFSVQQLATISDEALDNAYGYGRSSPGNTFGWQANLKSAAYAKHMIDKGVTDIEAISDAIHKGWWSIAQKFVDDPDQFDDTETLRAKGKFDTKMSDRIAQMVPFDQLTKDQQDIDRVVARALLQALKGKQGVADGSEWETKHDEFTTVGDRATPEQINKIVKALIGAAQQARSKRGFLNQIVGKQSNGDLARMAHGAETLAKNIQRHSNAKTGTDERKELGQQLVYAVSLLKRMNGKQGVAEGSNDTVYPDAKVIKSKNGKPIGEIYQDTHGWGCFHYKADNGGDGMSSKEEALELLKDMHNEHKQQGMTEDEAPIRPRLPPGANINDFSNTGASAEAPIRPRLPPGANINDFSNTGATAGGPPANEKDLGNGFTLTTTNYNGQNYPAVLDTQSKTYWIEKPAGSGTQYGMASYLRIVNGKADGKQPGDQTVDAMNAAGWKAASTSSPSPSPEPSANAPFVPRDYQTKEPLTQGTDGKWRNSKGEERDSLHGGPVTAQGTAQFRSLNIPTPESVDRMRGNVKIRKQGVAENKLPKPYKKWAS